MILSPQPRVEGRLLSDESSRREFSTDLARNVQRLPAAVLKPRSAEDVVTIIRHANRTGLKVGVRGQGHSRYGQTLAEGGIVIDTSTLDEVEMVPGEASITAQAGACWGNVWERARSAGKTPPAMGTCMKLSVGGLISVGGYSNRSHIFGGVCDTVEELEVVTGDGRRASVSATREPELFWMTLAGIGQCGVITRAAIRLIPAPASVVRQDLLYDDEACFVADAQRLVGLEDFGHLNSRAVQRRDGRWIFIINVGRFYEPGREVEWNFVPRFEAEYGKLRYAVRSEPFRAGYNAYVYREWAKNEEEKSAREQTPRHEPSIVMFIPASEAAGFIDELLASPEAMAGLGDFQLNPFNVRKFQCPLFKFPNEDVAFGFWLYPRNVALGDQRRHDEIMAINRQLLDRMRALGGKSYPPYAPYFSRAEWEQHYGPETWLRLLKARPAFDPNHVLSPGLFID